MEKTLKIVGYWNDKNESRPSYSHPSNIREQANYAPIKNKVVHYLRSGKVFRSWMGCAENRLPGIVPSERLGSRDLTDGEWVWPEGLDAYVEFANIRLPVELIFTMQSNGFEVPDLDGQDLEDCFSVSNQFWLRWCQSGGDPDRE